MNKTELKELIKEELALMTKSVKRPLLLEEPSDYLRDYKAGLITREEYDALVRKYNQEKKSAPKPKKSNYVGRFANGEKINAIYRALAVDPKNKFLNSIFRVLYKGYSLTDRQNNAVRNILKRTSPDDVKLFKNKDQTIKEGMTDKQRFVSELAADAGRDYSDLMAQLEQLFSEPLEEMAKQRDVIDDRIETLEDMLKKSMKDWMLERYEGSDLQGLVQKDLTTFAHKERKEKTFNAEDELDDIADSIKAALEGGGYEPAGDEEIVTSYIRPMTEQ